MIRIKICGITTLEDAHMAIEAGADALGFVFYEASPRAVDPDHAAEIIRALPPFTQTVGLFVNGVPDTINSIADLCGLDIIQLHGDEPPEYCDAVCRRVIKAFSVKDRDSLNILGSYRVAGYLLDAWSPDARGGTGISFNWELAAEAVQQGHRIILAGGLTPANISDAIRTVHPYGIDVSSGVESAPGRKDRDKTRAFISAARDIHAQ